MTRDHFLSIYATKAGLGALSANGTRTCEDFRDKVEHVVLETLTCARCGQHFPSHTGPCGCGFRLEGAQS